MTTRDFLDCPPSPLSLIESLRNLGYSMETSVADIIDNSITADASRIWIRFAWNDGKPWFAITDNGCGMSNDELKNAMRLGSMNPLEERAAYDLGRFGLGMKTASFSQCRHLTVLSKAKSKINCYEWDLDQITGKGNCQWRLGIINNVDERKTLSSVYKENLRNKKNGTIVLWKKLDRIDDGDSPERREKAFNLIIDDMRKHLELVFHRFLAPSSGKKRLIISMNGDELTAFDPFNPRNFATQDLPEQRISLDGEEIVVQPFVLPHHDKVSKEEYERLAGNGGYLHNQGFYVYRNMRLIIKGTWFRLIKKHEMNKLIRVRVDIPNTLDHLWNIDVKKSNATPPERVRKALHQIIGKIEDRGRKVYQQRGQNLASAVKVPVWNRRARNGRVIYELNRKHPLIQQLLNSVSSEHKKSLKDIMATIETTFPVEMFFSDFASNPEEVENPGIDDKILEAILDRYISFWTTDGTLNSSMATDLMLTEPFVSNSDLTKQLLEQRGYSHE